MKTIKPDELYQNLGDFLKVKGIEFKDGEYAQRIRQGCNLLTETINATQNAVRRAKAEADKKLDQLRQSIHEATAPRSFSKTSASRSAARRKPKKNQAGSKQRSPTARTKVRRRK